MQKKTLIVTAVVNGMVYQSKVEDKYIEHEEKEQIASCKRQIRKMLDEEGLSDVHPDYVIEKHDVL